MRRQYEKIILSLIAVIAVAFLNYYKDFSRPNGLSGDSVNQNVAVSNTPSLLPKDLTTLERHTVVRIVDGDTIVIDTGEKVRYIGVNTPESVDPRRPVQCFGKEASLYNKELVLDKKVALVKDVDDKDAYGRLLRYVYLEDGTFVNLNLVTEGYANVMTIQPNVAHAKDFIKAERAARLARKGLWGSCK